MDSASETLAPATGTAEGSVATADAGYHFVNWTNAAGTEASTLADFTPAKVGGLNVAETYTANFEEDEDITINYKATTGGTVDSASETLAPATGTAEGSVATADAGYHFVNWTNAAGTEASTLADFTPAKVGGLNVAETYTANFEEDEDITINYKATTGGTVDSASETLAPATGTAEGSVATADAGYHFVNWTNAAGTEASTLADFTPAKVGGLNVAETYTANFEEDEDITINYKATTGGTVDSASETPCSGNGNSRRISGNSGCRIPLRELDERSRNRSQHISRLHTS